MRADISQFYGSIYTHSVPWALHTKPVAKASMKVKTLPGNVLDRELQACQFGQTKGIAIGPDTSLGIAELLLSSIDLRIKDECGAVGGMRFIDDMEFTFRRISDAETALQSLEAFLNTFELQLNSAKTKIIELPDQIESVYVTMLRPHVPTTYGALASHWIDFFNRAFIAARAHPSDTVLRYAVSAMQGVVSAPAAWGIGQSLLWQCISADPGCLRFVVDVLLINKAFGNDIDIDIATEAINSLIKTSCPVGHGSEVLWSIWSALILNIPVDIASQEAIAGMDDCFVACAAQIAKERGLFATSFESSLWASWLVEEAFTQDRWLFAYEALLRGWYPSAVAAAKIGSDPNAVFLASKGVTFIEGSSLDDYTPSKLINGQVTAADGVY